MNGIIELSDYYKRRKELVVKLWVVAYGHSSSVDVYDSKSRVKFSE